MSGQDTEITGNYQLSDPAALAQNMTSAFEKAAQIAQFLAEQPRTSLEQEAEAQVTPVEQVTKTLAQLANFWLQDPAKLVEANMRLWQGHAALWDASWRRYMGEEVKPIVEPERGDRRFKDEDWQKNQIFDFLKQSYLITSKWALDMVSQSELDEHTRRKARFYVEQIANAFSPSNFIFTNPEVLRATLASNGANIVEGMDHLLRDLQAGQGRLRIRQTDNSAFEIGRNLAMTPGKVVFRNEIMELIQYARSTPKVHKIPLVIAPPWINKFYILDLNEKKSFIRWAVAQGHTVFVISWANAEQDEGLKTFDDYVEKGFLTAVDVARDICGTQKVNAIGYCVGGTMVASAMGLLAHRKQDKINAVTFFTTQVDFEKAGDLLVYVDEEQLEWIESRMADKGYLPGKRMADAFNLLRSNDLIWSYVINNYLLGKDPVPFDLLYWNSDGTRMPAAVHSFYLRNCYLKNALAKGEMEVAGVKIDLSKVKTPIYNLIAREDHIAPLASVYRLGRYFSGPVKVVVSGSGHIAGVVNPPEAGKYQYWTNDAYPETHEEWLQGAKETPGSWWPDWDQWLSAMSGPQIAARKPGSKKYPALEDAPGSYVRVIGVD